MEDTNISPEVQPSSTTSLYWGLSLPPALDAQTHLEVASSHRLDAIAINICLHMCFCMRLFVSAWIDNLTYM